jgi:RLL motif-containing protein 1
VEKHTGLNTSSLNVESSDPVLDKGANALARILQVSQHHDPSVLLAACRLVIEEKLSEESLRDAQEKASSSARYHEITPQQCGFSFSDPVLGEAAKVLRLLHVKELRELQTKVNELIVAAQSITANPKTDSSLGRVGK